MRNLLFVWLLLFSSFPNHACAASAEPSSWGPSLKDLKDALSDFLTVKKYLEDLTEARNKGKSVEPPRLKKVLGSDGAMTRLDALLKSLEEFKMPPETSPSAPPRPTLGGVFSARTASQLRHLAHQALDSMADMIQRYKELSATKDNVRDVYKTADAVRDAATIVQNALTKFMDILPETRNVYGLPAAELLTSFEPKLMAIATEAKLRWQEIESELKVRGKHIENFGQNIFLLLQEEMRRVQEDGKVLSRRSEERDFMSYALRKDIKSFNERKKREEGVATNAIRHNQKREELTRERAQLDSSVKAVMTANWGKIFDEAWYKSVHNQYLSLDERDAAFQKETARLEREMSESNERWKVMNKEIGPLNARVKEYNKIRKQLDADTQELNTRKKSINEDRNRWNSLTKLVGGNKLRSALTA